MRKPIDGLAQPALGEQGQEEALKPKAKVRTYSKPNGEQFQLTEDEFWEVVAIFDFWRKSRDERDIQPESLELEKGTKAQSTPVDSRKAG